MKIGNVSVKRVAPDAVIVQQEIDAHETGCFVSKTTDDDIQGRYLHVLASAVADVPGITEKHLKMVKNCLQHGVSAAIIQQGVMNDVLDILDIYRK